MLSFMRKHARSWFIKVLLGAVIVVFILFYGFNLWDREASLIASVGDAKISLREFRVQHERLLQAQQGRRSELTPEQRRMLKETTLESLVDQFLLLQQADRWQVTVGDAEISEYIRGISLFQEDGNFSYPRFLQHLRTQGQTEEEFMKELHRFLRIQKLEDLIRDGVKVTDAEVEAVYRLFNDRVVLQYVAIGPEALAQEVTVTPQEVESYFQEHRGRYEIPESVAVSYLRFDPKDYASAAQVSEKELEERYGTTRDRWREAKQVLARQIFLRSAEDEDPDARKLALQRAEDLLRRLQKGEEFGKLAREHSEDKETAPQGGLMGWKRQGELPEALEKALFEEMSQGQMSERPAKSPQGFHILRLEEARAERVKPLEEVRETLEGELRQSKSVQLASDMARAAHLEIFKGMEMGDCAKQHGLTVMKTEAFPLAGPVKALTVGEAFRKAAFALKDREDFSDVVEDGGVFYVLQLQERIPRREPRLEEVQGRVQEDLQRAKATEHADARARSLLQSLRQGRPMAEAAGQGGWNLQTTPTLTRMAPVAALPATMIQAAFSQPPDEPLLPDVYRQGDRFLVAVVKERIPSDPKGLEEQRPLYRSLLLQDRKRAKSREWVSDLRARTEIRTYRAFDEFR
jgi:peptidyl-prolyl cis-trans isomerase D